MGLEEALVEAGSVRLRPILMTTATTVLGLLPMSLGLGDGAEIRTPMAITVIAGPDLEYAVDTDRAAHGVCRGGIGAGGAGASRNALPCPRRNEAGDSMDLKATKGRVIPGCPGSRSPAR